jgi:hypothetical protein
MPPRSIDPRAPHVQPRRVPSPRVLGLGIGALVLTAVASGRAQGARSPSCPPTVVLDGPGELVEPVASTLRSHGVVVGSPTNCAARAVRASLAASPPRESGALQLHVQDPDGRTSDRVVASPALAASLIESWTVDEDADLLTRAEPARPAPSLTAVAPPEAVATTVAASSFAVAATFDSASATDGSIWWGGHLEGCGRLGRVCLGARLGLWRDAALGGPTASGGLSRFATDALLVAAAPLRSSGRFVLTPSLGLGFEWNRTTVPGDEGTQTIVSARGPRADTSLAIGAALSRSFDAILVLGATWAPTRAGAQELDAGGTFPGEPAVVVHAGIGGAWHR